jgi:hypothetical protein
MRAFINMGSDYRYINGEQATDYKEMMIRIYFDFKVIVLGKNLVTHIHAVHLYHTEK